MDSWGISPEAAALHGNALVWDNHTCLPLRPDDRFLPQLQRFRDSGVDMVSVNITFDGIMPWFEGVKVLAFFRNWLLNRPDDYVLVREADDILSAKRSGKLAVAFDIEGMDALDGQASLLPMYYDLGVRWMLIAYNRNNAAGGGCMDDDPGLTAFGREVVDMAAEVGMVICCSHTGQKTCMDVFERTKRPVLLSHSNPKTMVNHPRNVTDDVMKACAATGGVVGLVGYGLFLQHGDTSAENFARHVDYAVNVVGADHVGLGVDYVFDEDELKAFLKNTTVYPDGAPVSKMVEPEQMPAITEALLRHGHSDADIRGILGENLLRVARTVWR
jgi:membrane dipeptidase